MHIPKIVAVGVYNSRVIRPNVSVSKNRKASMFEIELPIEKGGISYIDQESRPIDTNLIICAKPGQIRHTKFPFKCCYIHMIVQQGELFDTLMNMPTFFTTDKADIYKGIFEEIIHHYNTLSPSKVIMIQSNLLKLIYTLNEDVSTHIKTKSTNVNNTITKILEYIDNHLTENLSLNALAKICRLSPIHFHNSFKSAIGKTLRTYVEEQRIKKAINMLLTTELTLTQIAFECGFSSQSYFSYVFKRKMKCTPREYVVRINKKYETS